MTNSLETTNAVSELPEPDEQSKQHSQKLVARIEAECAGDVISFRRYMELALYEPELGYYSAGLQKFGQGGDFITAPEISPMFSHCLARQCAEVFPSLDKPSVIEVGAGSGVMAAEILLELERLDALPDQYLILEISTYLRQCQKETIASRAPQLLARVRWLDSLPDEAIDAVILGNEVLDAMPVEGFQKTEQGLQQLCVRVENGVVSSTYREADIKLVEAVDVIEKRLESEIQAPYQSEYNPALAAWISSLAACMRKGVLLLIDYGYPVAEYYHPQRHMGTLVCHYQHRAHPDPFRYPGLQDITAFVDFSAVAYAAVDAGLEVRGYTTQAAFLLAAGLEQSHQQAVTDDVATQVSLSQQIKTLTLPSEMGERFKVIALTKGIEDSLRGFSLQDYRSRL